MFKNWKIFSLWILFSETVGFTAGILTRKASQMYASDIISCCMDFTIRSNGLWSCEEFFITNIKTTHSRINILFHTIIFEFLQLFSLVA